MYRSQQHKGKSVISITDGVKLGEIKDFYLKEDLSTVGAIYLGSEGLVHRTALAVDRTNVTVFGRDAFLVSGSDAATEIEHLPGWDSLLTVEALKGKVIQTEAGTKIGTVGDVILSDDGCIEGFTLDKVHVKEGPLATRKTIARSAIKDVGSHGLPMITLLQKAEELDVTCP